MQFRGSLLKALLLKVFVGLLRKMTGIRQGFRLLQGLLSVELSEFRGLRRAQQCVFGKAAGAQTLKTWEGLRACRVFVLDFQK